MTGQGALQIDAHAATDVGRTRKHNEDSLFAGRAVFAVADGMGGHQAGEVASNLALEPMRSLDEQPVSSGEQLAQALVDAVAQANREVINQADADPDLKGMGTTLSAVAVHDGRLYGAHVGDSRVYLLRGGESLTQLSSDHTLVSQLIRDGQLSPDEAASHPQRSVITRAIGVDADVEVDALAPVDLEPGDQVLLCSDGLTGPVSDTEIVTILTGNTDGDRACNELIEAANAAGGPDNITVVLLRANERTPGRAGARGAAATASRRSQPTQRISTLGPGRDQPTGSSRQPGGPVQPPEGADTDWAASMSRLGQQQGVQPEHRGGKSGHGHGRRALVGVLAVVLLLGLVIGGGALLLSRAYFVGDDDGTVALYQGVPQDAFGIALHRLTEASDVPTARLSVVRQRRLQAGVTVADADEGRRLIERYRQDLEGPDADDDNDDPSEADTDDDPFDTGPDDADDETGLP